MIKITENLCPKEKWSVKCPYTMSPEGICIHNTANDASAKNEVSYMLGNKSSTSFHYAVDDQEAVHGIPDGRNAWHAGDGSVGRGNRKYISIEICYSKSGGPRFETAMKNAAELTAMLLKKYGWDTARVKKHQDFSGKYCPHRILSDYGWDYFLNLVRTELDESEGCASTSMPVLQKGAKGDAVKQLQERLNELGASLEIDGSFGPATLAAVKDFQASRGLDADGSVGPLTWEKLLEEPETSEKQPETAFQVRVDIDDLNIRKGPGTNYRKTGLCTGKGVFTIVNVKDGKGSDSGWGELKSGAGWVSLDFARRI